MSRVRPVALGAATTILGVVPLIQDAFWVAMALTMIMVPTFYATLYKIKSPAT